MYDKEYRAFLCLDCDHISFHFTEDEYFPMKVAGLLDRLKCCRCNGEVIEVVKNANLLRE